MVLGTTEPSRTYRECGFRGLDQGERDDVLEVVRTARDTMRCRMHDALVMSLLAEITRDLEVGAYRARPEMSDALYDALQCIDLALMENA